MMKRYFVHAFIASLLLTYTGCASTSGQTSSPQTASDAANAQSQNTQQADASKHAFWETKQFRMFSYPECDLMLQSDIPAINAISLSNAANQLAQMLRDKNLLTGRPLITLHDGIHQVDNSYSYLFTVYGDGTEKEYYVTEWAKVLDNNGKYVGRIAKGVQEPGPVPNKIETKDVDYQDFKLTIPVEFKAIDGFSVEDAAAYVAHHAIPQLMDSSACEAWTIWLDGISQIEGGPAYDFSVYHHMTSEDSMFELNDKYAPTFRIAVAANKKAYLYEMTLEKVGTLENRQLPEALPPDEDTLKAIESFKDKQAKGLLGTAIMLALMEKLSYTAYPNYRFKLNTQVEDNDRDFVHNAAENLYAWANNHQGVEAVTIQSVSNGTQTTTLAAPYSTYLAKSESTNAQNAIERLILYRGKQNIDGNMVHRFAIGYVNIHMLNPKPQMEMAVHEDGTIYRLKPAIRFYSDIPSSIEPAQIQPLDDDLVHDYASKYQNGSSSASCNRKFIMMNVKDSLSETAPKPKEAADYLFEHRTQYYEGKANINPWYITQLENSEVDGTPAYVFAVGQGKSGNYPIYFKAAIDETGKVYRYDGDTPKYIETIQQDDQPKALSKTEQQIESMIKEFKGSNAKTSAKANKTEPKEQAPVYPASAQNIDELKKIYGNNGITLPKITQKKIKVTDAFFDFNYAAGKKDAQELKNLTGLDAAAYIDRQILPNLKIYSNTPWVFTISGKEPMPSIPKDALILTLGMSDKWDEFKPKTQFIVSEDRKVYHPEDVPKYIKDMPEQPIPQIADVWSFSYNNGLITHPYPLFNLTYPAEERDCDGYTLPQAAAEIEAAYLHEHNDGKWTIAYRGITEIEGVKAWKIRITYGDNEVSQDLAATANHKLYQYVKELKHIGTIPKKVEPPAKDDTPENKREIDYYEQECGIGTLNNKVHEVPIGDYVSLKLAGYWIFETLAKTYTGKHNNNPWRIVPTGTTKIDNVDAYEFDVGQGKYKLTDILFKAAVTQDRKIYKVTDGKLEIAGTIPEDAPEP